MTRPAWVYRFQRHRKDHEGSRFDLVAWDGPGYYAPLVCPLKKTGEPVVYVNRWKVKAGEAVDPRKGGLILAAPGRGKGDKGRNLSSIFEPMPEAPGWGFGDLERDGVKRLDAILTHREEEADSFTVFVFPGLGMQSETLFHARLTGGVALEVDEPQRMTPGLSLYNNVPLTSDFDTNPENG